MKKITFLSITTSLAVFLEPYFAFAQYIENGSGDTRPVSGAATLFVVALLFFLGYTFSHVRKEHINAFFKTFIEGQLLITSAVFASLNTFAIVGMMYLIEYGNFPEALTVVAGIGICFFSIFIIPLCFVFTKGWRHFIASSVEIILFTSILVYFFAK